MAKLAGFLMFFGLLMLMSVGARAQDVDGADVPEIPDVSGWKIFSSSNISAGLPNFGMYYLGLDITYQNPVDKNEFVRQIRIIVPFVAVKSSKTMDRNSYDAAITYVTDGEERDLLKTGLKESDLILCIRWKIKKDVNRNTDALDGENEIWFFTAFGNRIYSRNRKITVDTLSERPKGRKGRLINVGKKYSLSQEAYYAKELPHSIMIIVSKGLKEGK